MRRLLVLALVWLGLVSCATMVRLPDVIGRRGGFYIPWDSMHAAHRADVLACVTLDDKAPPPTLWVSAHPIEDEVGLALMAFYDREAHAIVYAPYVTVDEY